MHRPGSKVAIACVALSTASLIGCGKKADPLPPFARTPRPPEGLEIAQRGDRIELTVRAPRTTTEGRPLSVIDLVIVEGPAAGEFGRGVERFREPVAPGEPRVRRLPIPSAPVRYSAFAAAGRSRSSLVSPTAFAPAPIPEAPAAVTAQNTARGVLIGWENPPGAEPWGTPVPSATPSPSPEASPSGPPSPSPTPAPSPAPITRGVRVFRVEGVIETLIAGPLQASAWTDGAAKVGSRACYSLRYAASLKPLVESAASAEVCADVRDVAAPEAPAAVTADQGDGFVEVAFEPSTSGDVVAHRVYRERNGARAPVVTVSAPTARVRDTDVQPGPVLYFVSALDAAGNESPLAGPFRIVVR